MPRRPLFVGPYVYHVINRAAAQMKLFKCAKDYIAAQELLFELKLQIGIRLLAFCIMPNHWHFIIWPRSAAEMSRFLQSFTGTHAQRWRAAYLTTGRGCVYQGRYKAIPVQTERYFLNVCRYVERNPLRAHLVHGADEWPWSSCAARERGADQMIDAWPITCPSNWLAMVNTRENDDDLQHVRDAVSRSIPYGDPEWVGDTAKAMGVESRLRPRGRPAIELCS
jgi:putative transposase